MIHRFWQEFVLWLSRRPGVLCGFAPHPTDTYRRSAETRKAGSNIGTILTIELRETWQSLIGCTPLGKYFRGFGALWGEISGEKACRSARCLAAVVKLLETTFIRIGNEEYVEENGSFGLTTLRNQHAEVLGDLLKFRFKGKSGQRHEIKLEDKRLARIVRRCKDIPGSSLFEYIDEEGKPQSLESGDVNEYLRSISGGEFTAKDFRTWGGTCLAAEFLLAQLPETDSPTKAALVEVVKEVACKLGNKPATCRKYYIHPIVLETFEAGTLREFAEKFKDSRSNYMSEQLVLSLLKPDRRAGRRNAPAEASSRKMISRMAS